MHDNKITPTASVPKQRHLFYADLVAEAQETADWNGIDVSVEAAQPETARRPGGRRSGFPPHVPQVTTRYELSESERIIGCGHGWHEIGVESAKEIERIEVNFVHVYERADVHRAECWGHARREIHQDKSVPILEDLRATCRLTIASCDVSQGSAICGLPC